jgi:hypothetical protein
MACTTVNLSYGHISKFAFVSLMQHKDGHIVLLYEVVSKRLTKKDIPYYLQSLLRAPKLHLQKVDVVNLMSHERFSSKS